MPGIEIVTKTGPRTYTVDQAVVGGQVVEGRSNGRIGVAAAGSTRVLGVALTNAVKPEDVQTEPTVVNGYPVLPAVPQPTSTSVAYSGAEVRVTFAGAANFGDRLIAAANGQVAAAGATPDARTVFAVCTEPGGVAEAGVKGLIRIL